MGFTIEDMLNTNGEQFQMSLRAGKNGWSNSISFLFLTEDMTLLDHFSGRELAITTCLGFKDEPALMALVKKLVEKHSSALIINEGYYIHEIPQSVLDYCDENDYPLITIPWEMFMTELIKDLSIRIFMQSSSDEQITAALINAIEDPDAKDSYYQDLMPNFNVDGNFQMILMSTGNLDEMDSVLRRRISHRLQIYLENITHNAHFFYYNGDFILMVNDVSDEMVSEIVAGFRQRVVRRMPEHNVYVGVGSTVKDLTSLHLSYQRAKCALTKAIKTGTDNVFFDEMGNERLLYTATDKQLLYELGPKLLAPLIEHDTAHNSCYVETLSCYLENNGSFAAMTDRLFTHRSTIIYRMSKIKEMLDTDLSTYDDRFKYQIACAIVNAGLGK